MAITVLNSSGCWGGLWANYTNPTTHTLYDGVNRMVLVYLVTGAADNGTITGIDINGVSMTKVVGLGTDRQAHIWSMMEADLPWGNNTLTITYTGATSRFGTTICSYAGVKQQAPTATATRFNPLERYPYVTLTTTQDSLVAMVTHLDGIGLNEWVGDFQAELCDTACSTNVTIGVVHHLDANAGTNNWNIDWTSNALSSYCAGATWALGGGEELTRNPLCVQLGVNN